MSSPVPKYVPPSITETAFNCPHCGALAKQSWFSLKADPKEKDELPLRISEDTLNREFIDSIEDLEERRKMQRWAERVIAGTPFVERNKQGSYVHWDLYNADLSRCFNCDKVAIWVQSALVFPVRGDAPLPNPDLPEDVRLDFDEAGRILRLSPRGASALLRLAIQKLCKEVGGNGKNIDSDIAALVEKGLDVRIQQALDVVRVIGNNAVHPGQVDLRDDVGTAEKLFDLVNIIADAMISQPKRIAEMFDGLPQGARDAIAKRDGKIG
ncbi:DUF4145 domain-containing protein [Tsuneonella sp. CC-YZS046]|uniref:DUF4145 domain-containing protein n=1 Tax=Tsuneonella sp. CC-YZS046 TaxID=3042152 RepID=UPI002D76B08C|nr:DUF4145 domain-containing protein [Tsuneonella sp. CC-YZS046]WRO65394.1 DUF4145 domain-containing protein [Tsuneonella sp. CC-YZS046]